MVIKNGLLVWPVADYTDGRLVLADDTWAEIVRPRRGFPSWQVNRISLQFVAALFGQGAGVIFGHDWREDGVMEAVHGFALQMQPPIPLSAETAQAEAEPLMRNLLPWPDEPRLSQEEQEQLTTTLKVESPGFPRAAGNGVASCGRAVRACAAVLPRTKGQARIIRAALQKERVERQGGRARP